MTFKAVALEPEQFVSWFRLADSDLQQRGARGCVADAQPGFPCRVSLQDAAIGERLVLLHYEHHPVDSPYRAAGPIFVREDAQRWQAPLNVVPPVLRSRLLSVRAYDALGMLQDADVLQGETLEARIESMFADARIAYLHVHFARPGCYACRIERA
jgi:hypothetical protein